MFKSTLTEILKTFSRQEIKEFSLFIQSPFFNTNQSVMKLYEQLSKLYPEFDAELTDKKIIFKKAFGKIDYNDSFMRMTVFRLTELAKEYLIFSNLQANSLFKNTILLDELNNRELDNLLNKSIADLDKKIRKEKAKDAETYYFKFKLEYYKNDIKSRDTKMITYKDILDKDLILEQKYMNTNFFINSLKFFQYFLNQKNFVVSTEGYPDFISEILGYLKQTPEYLDAPELNLYYKLVLLLITKDEQYFFELYKILFEDYDELKINSKHNLITVLKNYAHLKIQHGSKEYIEKAFEILKFSLEKDIVTFSPSAKYMTETRFMNIAWSGLILKKFDFTEKFINKYIDKVEPEKRKYVYAYNFAKLEFERGNFSEALKRLSDSGQIKNIMYKAAMKQLYVMIYYELKWFVQAAELVDSYRHFIRTDKLLPEMYKSQCNTFVNYTGKLLTIINNPVNKSYELEKLIAELKSTNSNWLLRKAMELSSGGDVKNENEK